MGHTSIRNVCFLWAAWRLLSVAPPVSAQTITGSITGTILDTSEAAIPGTAISLRNENTGQTRNAVTSVSGSFVFTALQPSVYALKAQKTGFQTLERSGIVLTANERVALGELHLPVGEVSSAITVSQRGETLDLESADTTGLLNSKQLETMVVRGRDVMNLLRTLPGVSTIAIGQGGETSEGSAFGSSQALGGQVGSFTPTVSGARLWWNSVTVDGQVGSNPDWPGLFMAAVSMDGVSEVKVVSNNYTAEDGRNMGASINIVSKSGSKDFHGTVYWYKRHEEFNANDFFNNRAGLAKPVYRFGTIGGALGGPVYIPGHFNRNKDKLFFFYSEEDWQVTSPTGFTQLTVPTALERGGNFSQTLDQSGKLIPITDPLSGAAFPGNIVPANRINANGQVLLNLLPLPNSLDRNVTRGAFNYQWQESLSLPKRLQQLKLDYHPTGKDTISLTPRRWWADTKGFSQTRGFNNVPLLKARHLYSVDSAVVGWTRILTPAIVNEFNTGFTGEKERGKPNREGYFDPVDRTKVGFTLGQLYPQANPYNIIPQATYGGVPGPPNVTNDSRLPKNVAYERFHFTDNLSWTHSSHLFKFGVYMERAWATDGPASAAWNGSFDFGRDPNNPLDTNWAFSNALIGNFRVYTESNRRSNYRGTNTLVEWFAQDSWKVTRRLTLTYGLRFSRFSPWHYQIGQGAGFITGLYSASKISPFYAPALDASGNRVGRNPVTGQLVPAVLIGAFVPGVGDPFNGVTLSSDTGYGNTFVKQRAVQVSPRFGFAYDVFGNGRTAVRGGFGIAKQATPSYSTYISSLAAAQPVVLSPQIYYSTMDTLRQSTGVIFPGSEGSYDADAKVPSVYHYSFGIQQALGFSTVIDASYVGNVGRHLIQNVNINTLPYGVRFLASSADPTGPSRALPDAFLRPYLGYNNLNYILNAGTSNYNSLQVGVNRRFSRGVQFGVAYTWSKSMGYGSGDGESMPLYRPWRVWAYGPTYFDQTHMLVLNYIWDLPKASHLAPNPVVRHVFDNWQFAGVTTFSSGLPQSISLATTDNADITGGGDGSRAVVIAPVQLAGSDRSFTRYLNTAAFARPAKGDPGNASVYPFRGPGVNNWDLTLTKAFPLWSETRKLQFRWELYNAFNHTQYQAIDTTARFDPAGVQSNARFGQVIAMRPARVMQFALRLQF